MSVKYTKYYSCDICSVKIENEDGMLEIGMTGTVNYEQVTSRHHICEACKEMPFWYAWEKLGGSR